MQSVEKQAGGFVFDLSGEQQAHHLHDGDLDGVGVFKDGQVERWNRLRSRSAEQDALLTPSSMEVAEAISADGRRSALRAVDLDVLTSAMLGW